MGVEYRKHNPLRHTHIPLPTLQSPTHPRPRAPLTTSPIPCSVSASPHATRSLSTGLRARHTASLAAADPKGGCPWPFRALLALPLLALALPLRLF